MPGMIRASRFTGDSPMRVLALPALIFFLLLSMPARAEVLLGVMTSNGLNGVNVEWVGEEGSVWVLAGAYQASTGLEPENLTGLVGFRRFLDGKYESGFFGGAFAGDVDGGTSYNRFGAGGELGYQWVKSNLRTTLQAGVALVGDATGDSVPEEGDTRPVLVLGASVSMRL